ncbi:hypothetical protein ACFL08_00440 [Patescibacteria group bacterium]
MNQHNLRISELDSCILLLLRFAKSKGILDLSSAQINKIIYDLQIKSIKFTGEKFNEDVNYSRYQRGPISREVKRSLNRLEFYDLIDMQVKQISPESSRFCHRVKDDEFKLNLTEPQIIFATSTFRLLEKKYSGFWDRKVKLELGSYDSEPMLRILERERELGIELLGEAIDFNDVTLDANFLDTLDE